MKSIDAGEHVHAAAIEDFGSWETALECSVVPARDIGRSRKLTPSGPHNNYGVFVRQATTLP
ncbi:hypothetical protein [Rhodopirellula europaea]|uniref:hypothetical protein n=1 Tax=Rhodopirellula europaea TaxID=1263866 RepID=UPI003D2C3E45